MGAASAGCTCAPIFVNAELLLDSVAWHKPKGKPSTFEFDVIKGGHSTPSS